MGIAVGAWGRIYLPYLQNWSHVRGETDMKSRSKTGSRNEGCFNKITVAGAGDLGIACVLAVAAKDVADKVVLSDLSEGAAKGGTKDLELFAVPNVEVSKVEVMTFVLWKLSSFPKSRVIGAGASLDSERFQYILTNLLKAKVLAKDAWVIGEQGEDKAPSWTSCNAAANQTEAMAAHNSREKVAHTAMEILKGKGQSSWSVGLSVADLVDSILKDKRKVHSVSTLAKGCCNLNSEVFLSLPCILGTSGVIEMVRLEEDPLVQEKLQAQLMTFSSS